MVQRIAGLGLMVMVVALGVTGCDRPSTITQDLGPGQLAGTRLEVEQHGVFSPLNTVTWEIRNLDPSQTIGSMKGWVGLENGQGSPPVTARWDSERKAYVIDLMVPATLPRDSQFWVEVNANGRTEKAAWNYEVTQR